MRSRQTTNLLLLLAFLFIFAVILLCLIPSKPTAQPVTEKRIHGSRVPHSTTSKPRTTEPTNSPLSSTYTSTMSTTTTLPKTDTTSTSTTSSRPIIKKITTTSTEPTTKKSTTTPSTTTKSTTTPSTTTKSTTTPSTTTKSTTTPSTTTKSTKTPFTTIEYITSYSSTTESTINSSTTMITSPSTTSNSTTDETTYSSMTTESTTIPSTRNLYTTIISTTSSTPSTTQANYLTTSTSSSNGTTLPSTLTTTTLSTTATTTNSSTATTSTTPSIATTTKTPSTTTTTKTSSTIANSTTSSIATTTKIPSTTATTKRTSITTTSKRTPTTLTTTVPSTTITTSTLPSTSTSTIPTTESTTNIHIMFPSSKLTNVCNSTECKDLASKMLDSIDHATTPCLDFYEYSCGGITHDDFLVPEDPNVVLRSILNSRMVGNSESSLKNFYETCISTPSQEKDNFSSLFPSHLKITRENSDFTLIISGLLKSNIAVLFDVTVDLKGDDYNGRTFVPVVIPYSLNILFPSCIDREAMVEEQRILMSCAESTGHSRPQCQAMTGHYTRLEAIREAAKRFHLFDDTFTSSEQEAIFKNVINFLDEMTPSGCTAQPSNERKITIQDLRSLTDMIDWDRLFEDLFDGAFLETQDIYIRNMKTLQTTFEVFAGWNTSVLQNVFTLLAGEHAYLREQAVCRTNDHCQEMVVKLLPENVRSLLHEKNNPTNELASLTSIISRKIRKSSSATRNNSVDFAELEPSLSKNEISQISGHVSNIYFLREKKRKDMYRMIHLHTDEITHKDCKFLVEYRQQGCYLAFHKISAPLIYLVPPNFYMSEKIPKYLQLSGIAQYLTKILYEYYSGEDLIFEEYQSIFPMEIRNLNQIKVTESILEVAWESIDIHSKMSSREPPEYVQQSLIWLGKDSLKPLNAFLIRRAQALCRYSRDFDCSNRFKGEDFPNDWINSIMKTKLFAGAFGCRLPDIETTIRAFVEN